MIMLDKTRQAFEDWMIATFRAVPFALEAKLKDNDYADSRIQNLWQAFRACNSRLDKVPNSDLSALKKKIDDIVFQVSKRGYISDKDICNKMWLAAQDAQAMIKQIEGENYEI